MTVVIFLLLISGVLIQAYRDLSEPGAWDYWNDRYFSPSMTSSVAGVDLGGRALSGTGAARKNRRRQRKLVSRAAR